MNKNTFLGIKGVPIGWRYIWTLLFGASLSLLGIGVAYFLLPEGAFSKGPETCHHLTGEFARRWDGSCTGWSIPLSKKHIAGDLLHWFSYLTMAIIILIHHPTLRNNLLSRITVYLVGVFILGCGITHLVEAYTFFNPIYIFQANLKLINGIISVLAELMVIWGLLNIADIHRRRMDRISQLSKKIGEP